MPTFLGTRWNGLRRSAAKAANLRHFTGLLLRLNIDLSYSEASMEQMRRWMVALATLALIGVTAMIQFRFGSWYQQGGEIAVTVFSLASEWGLMLLFLHALKILLLPIAVDLKRGQYRVAAVLAVGSYLALATISVGTMLGALSLQRHERVAAEAATMKREGDLRSELAALRDWLKDSGWRRAVAEVEADISAQQRDERWATTGECTGPSIRSQRDYCARIDRFKGELAAAKAADEARRRKRAILNELRSVPPTSEVRHPDLDVVVRVFDVAVEQVSLWRTLWIAVTIEATEALPLWFSTLLAHPGGNRAGTATGRLWMRLVRAWAASRLRRHVPPPPLGKEADHDTTAVASRRSGTEAANTGARLGNGDSRQMANEAVTAFAGLLILDPEGRETGRALYVAYERVRARHSWPSIPASTFGALIKPVIERAGGRKVKSSCQLYTGVRLPLAIAKA